jgi:hypothetical protein
VAKTIAFAVERAVEPMQLVVESNSKWGIKLRLVPSIALVDDNIAVIVEGH